MLAANEALVLAGLEVGQSHDDAFRTDGGSQRCHTLRNHVDVELLVVHPERVVDDFEIQGSSHGCHALRNLVDVELLGASVSPHALINRPLVLSIQGVVVQQGLLAQPER